MAVICFVSFLDGKRLQRVKQSYEFEATPVMDRRRPPLVSQNTVTGVLRLDDEDEKNKIATGRSDIAISNQF